MEDLKLPSERQGSLLKDLIKSIVEEKQIVGVEEMKTVISEATSIKNNWLHHSGFTPSQWVLGRLPHEVCSLTSVEDEENLGVHQGINDPIDEFTRQLEIRQAAKRAFTQADASRRVRSALLRKSTPLRGPYHIEDLISFHRKGKWFGPGRIIGLSGRGNLWVVHGGIPMIVAESQVCPATRSEVLAKQLLELRPSRKCRRQDFEDSGNMDTDPHPFSEDLVISSLAGEDAEHIQPGYVEIPHEAGGAEQSTEGQLPDEEETPYEEVQDLEVETPIAPMERDHSAQPESEASHAPTVPPTPPMAPMSSGTLQTALNRSVDRLDGYPTPGTSISTTART